jgi:hypothetical protein
MLKEYTCTRLYFVHSACIQEACYKLRQEYDSLNLPRHNIIYGGPICFFPQAKISLPVGPKGQETPPGTVFEN